MQTTTEETALDLVRGKWNRISDQWDALRRDHPGENDLILVIRIADESCALMPRRTFLEGFNPPTAFDHLRKPAGDVHPARPREGVMWVLAIGETDDYASFRVSRHQTGEVEMDRRIVLA